MTDTMLPDVIYDDDGAYDFTDTYDGTSAFATFMPPTAEGILPPYLPTTTGPALGLFRHYKPYDAGVNVFLLSDGTYVQNYATAENANTSIPYPINFYEPGAPFSRVIDFTGVESDTTQDPYVVKVYYGAHANVITQAEAIALTAAGYGAYITYE
jgi:hypothetical protein